MRTNLLKSLSVVFACWYGVALLFWGFADPPQNALIQSRAHAMLPWVVPAPPPEVGILNAWQVQLTVVKTWGAAVFLIALASAGLGLLLAYFKIDSRLKAIRDRERPSGEYRGMKVSLGELPPPEGAPRLDELEIEHEDPLYREASPAQRAMFTALAGYLSANSQVPVQAEDGGTFLEESLARAELALSVRKNFVAALVELAYATGRVGVHHRECNPYKPGERVGFPKTQGYYASRVLARMPQWHALDEATRTEVLFGAKYYDNPKARPYRMGSPAPVPPTPLPAAAPVPVSATPPPAAVAAPAAAAPSLPATPARPAPVTATQVVPPAVVSAAPAVPAAAAPAPASVARATAEDLPVPAAVIPPASASPVDAPPEAPADNGPLHASFFTSPPTAAFTIEDHLVRCAIPLLKGIEWGHSKVPRHEYQSETNPKGRPLPFGWRHGKHILLLSNRLEDYLRMKLPAPMVDEADATPTPSELQRRGLKVSGLMAAFMRGLAKYEILHTELELDKPKGYLCRAAMPEVSLWTVKVGKARFKQVIVLRLRKSFVEHVTDEDGNFKDGMTVLDCYLPDKPVPTVDAGGINITPAITDGVSMADAVGMGLFKAAPAPAPVPVPAAPAAPPRGPDVPPVSAPNLLEDLFKPEDQPPAANPTEVKAAVPAAAAPVVSQPANARPERRPPPQKALSPLEAAGLAQPKKRSRHEP